MTIDMCIRGDEDVIYGEKGTHSAEVDVLNGDEHSCRWSAVKRQSIMVYGKSREGLVRHEGFSFSLQPPRLRHHLITHNSQVGSLCCFLQCPIIQIRNLVFAPRTPSLCFFFVFQTPDVL